MMDRKRSKINYINITSGIYRGRKILSPGAGTHPMGSREKLALFNMLGGKILNARLLDAFAGSGALGIEALSRGALEVVFVEKSKAAVDTIKDNLNNLGIDKGSQVVLGDAAKLSGQKMGFFDIVIADPPYNMFLESNLTSDCVNTSQTKNDVSHTIKSLGELLKTDGLLVLSHLGKPLELPGFLLLKSRQYAGAHISIYTRSRD